MPTPICFGFVGYSESGKTTLATAVTAELSRRGFKVAVLKDAHHQVDMDMPGKGYLGRYRENGSNTSDFAHARAVVAANEHAYHSLY